jgi:predicted RNase H-like HicB family nuclease
MIMHEVSGTSTLRKNPQIIPPLVWNDSFYEKANVSRMRSRGPAGKYLFSGTGAKIMNPSNWVVEENQTNISSFEIEITKDIPYELVEKYKKIAMQTAKVGQLDDGTWYAELPGFPGVWATDENSKENAMIALEEVLEDWVVIKIEMNDGDIPIVDGIDLN